MWGQATTMQCKTPQNQNGIAICNWKLCKNSVKQNTLRKRGCADPYVKFRIVGIDTDSSKDTSHADSKQFESRIVS